MRLRLVTTSLFVAILLVVSALIVFKRPALSELEDFKLPEDLTRWKADLPKGTKSREKTNILFLKTHKCASSTVQNILMRFGYLRHLDFVLPEINNYLGHPAPFERSMIPPFLASPTGTYNIFTHHSRYNYEEMKAVMKEGTAFVTILREPARLFESLYGFYHLEKKTDLSFLNFTRQPKSWYKADHSKLGRMGLNQMSFDLGFDVQKSQGQSSELDPVVEFIREIDSEFDLVMISEHMEASLILLCDLMNWPLENVVFLRLNSRVTTKRVPLSLTDHDSLLRMNSFDAQLYDYFLDKFKRRIAHYGVGKMKSRVRTLLEMNSRLWRNCIDKTNSKGYSRTTGYDLRNNMNFVCFYAAKQELTFTEEIRNDQLRRFSVLNKLNELMSEPAVEKDYQEEDDDDGNPQITE